MGNQQGGVSVSALDTSCPTTPSDTEQFDSLTSVSSKEDDETEEMMRALSIVGDEILQSKQAQTEPQVQDSSQTASQHSETSSARLQSKLRQRLSKLQINEASDNHRLDHETKAHISRELKSEEYPALARGLNLKTSTINHIEYECNQRGQGVSEIVYQIIEQWEQRLGSRATYQAMVLALRGMQRADIADQLHPDGELKEILKAVQNWQLEVYERDLQLPQLQWTEKILPLEELYVDLEMFETNKYGNEKEGRSMKLEDMFDPVDNFDPKRILIEGAPGYGKTTLTLKLLFDWIQDEVYMQRFNLVFAFSLRYFNEYSSLQEALMICLEETGIEPELGFECIRRFQDKILLLLDGYDELNEKSKMNLANLLKKKEFPNMFVVLTSRRGWFQLKDSEEAKTKIRLQLGVTYSYFWNKRIVIHGIAENNVEEFLTKYFKESSSQIDKAIQVFQKANKELFQCPLFLMLLAVIVEDEISEEIKTKTSLYRFFFNTVFRRGLIREELIAPEECIDIFNPTSNEKFYTKDFINFGKLALEHLLSDDLSITENEILEHTNENGYFLKLGIVTKNLVFPSNRNRFSEVFQPIHKTFLEFSASYYLHQMGQNLATDKHAFQSTITDLVDKGFGCSPDSLVYPFLGGLMNENAFLFFDAITQWSALFPIKSERMLNILDEIVQGENLTTTLVPFIPSIVKLDVFNFKENSFMKEIIGKLVQAGCQQNLIRVLELNPELFYKMTELTGSLFVDLLVLKIEQGEIVEPMKLKKKCQLQCNKLVCSRYLDDLPESDWPIVAEIITSIDAKEVSFEFYSFSFDHMMVKFFHQTLMEGKLGKLNIHRLAIPSVENTNETLPLWADVIKKQRINKSVLLSVSLVQPKELQQMIEEVAKAENVTHFGICKGFYSSAERIDVDFGLFCVGNTKKWKRLDFERITLDAQKLNDQKCSVAEITLKNTGSDDLKALNQCKNLEYLRCSAKTFQALIDQQWSQLPSLIELNLFDLDVLPNLLLLTNLQVLSLDMEEISLQTEILIKLILHSKLNKLILLNNGDDLFLTPLLRTWLETVQEMQEDLDNETLTDVNSSSKNCKSKLESLAIEVECYGYLPNDKFKSCFPLLRELLRRNHLGTLSLLMFDENLKLSPALFPVSDHFIIRREVNGMNAEKYATGELRQCSYFSSYISSYRRIRSNTFEGLAITYDTV